MFTKRLLFIAVAGAVLSIGGPAQASPLLQIVANAAGDPALAAYKEAIGDPGGTNHAFGPTAGASPGPGMPTVLGGWPAAAPGFATDDSFPPGGGGAVGISGWDGSYLKLTEAGRVNFQFMGKGDAGDHDQFQLDLGGVWTTIWDNESASNGTCGTTANPTVMNCPFAGSTYSATFAAGLIPFRYVNLSTTGTAIATNDGQGNPKDTGAAYFLGMDPYLASAPYTDLGRVTYAGFTDRSPLEDGDHDYEDLIVRMSSVPEPGSLALLGLALGGLAFSRKRKGANA